MSNINNPQRQAIQRIWSLDNIELDSVIANSVDAETRANVESYIKAAMISLEGKHIEDDVQNLWGSEYMDLVQEELVKYFKNQLSTFRDKIHKTVCIDFGYCAKRRDQFLGVEEWAVAVAVADALTSASIGIPFPITTVSVYLVKRQVLDKWCLCS